MTTIIRGQSWNPETSVSTILPANSVVRVVSVRSIDERRSEWLDDRVKLDRAAFVFCGLHAHMRLTEALVKDMHGRAIESGKVKQLIKAFKTHLDIQDRFVRNDAKRGWKRISFYGYECWRFAADSDVQGQSKIERVIREVWGEGQGMLAKGVDDKDRSLFLESYCALWRSFNEVMRLTRCKEITADLESYGAKCRDLGARWCLLLPRNRCSPFYLHTLMMHGGDFMRFCLQRGMTIGMLENSGAERRHEVGRVQFRKSLSGGGKAYRGMQAVENRSAYLTLRGLVIWQYGRDFLAAEIARAEYELYRGGRAVADRSRRGDGWVHAEARITEEFHREATRAVRDAYDHDLDLSDTLSPDALDAIENTHEGDAPPGSLLRAAVAASLPAAEDSVFDYGEQGTVNLEID